MPPGIYERKTVPIEDKFWARVVPGDPDECWEWQGTMHYKGYGMLPLNKKKDLAAHRVSWELANKTQVPEGLVVRHKCDNRRCVNPNHLETGTHKDNAQDRVQRGRSADFSGEKNPRAKLSEEHVNEIRHKWFTHSVVNKAQLAREYNVHPTLIYDVINYRSWTHI